MLANSKGTIVSRLSELISPAQEEKTARLLTTVVRTGPKERG